MLVSARPIGPMAWAAWSMVAPECPRCCARATPARSSPTAAVPNPAIFSHERRVKASISAASSRIFDSSKYLIVDFEVKSMLPSSTVENYLKAIFQAQTGLGRGGLVPMGQLASALGVVPGTATTMVKTLAESGLVKYEPYAGVRLTAAGERLAAM